VSSLEEVERLEQLRWLENGFKVSIVETTEETMCIDTPEDLDRARAFATKN
jgi:3-deoxy-manno-octulosonate cytidylyltransferase (CMP-KDO synthetase)